VALSHRRLTVEYKFVIVRYNGLSYELARSNSDRQTSSLASGGFVNVHDLLSEGWEPIRETSFGGGWGYGTGGAMEPSGVLVLFQRKKAGPPK
jgi:hypothetical protein